MDVPAEIQRLRRKAANVTTQEMCRLAEAAGWSGRRRKHWVYSRPGRFPVVIPDHSGSLKPGTVRQILDQLEEDYLTED